MTLSNYDPKLLNFLYELTKLKKFMSYRKIADNISLDGKKVSPKTVERWFSFLKQPYYHPSSKSNDKFDYYPLFYYEKLGLSYQCVIFKDPNPKILFTPPLHYYQEFPAWVYDPRIRKYSLLVRYTVPISHIPRFKHALQKVKEDALTKNYILYNAHTPFHFYSPWHKVIDKNGLFHPENNVEQEIDRQIINFENYMDNLPDPKMIPEVKNNLLIIPTLFEYWTESWSSAKVWNEIGEKMGDNVWRYIEKAKKKSRGSGIKKVQETIKDIHVHRLFDQTIVAYMPLELNHNFIIFSILKCNKKNEMLKIIKTCAMKSLRTVIFPENKTKVFMTNVINNKSLPFFFDILQHPTAEGFFFFDHQKSLPLLTDKKIARFEYHKLLDPVSRNWIK